MTETHTRGTGSSFMQGAGIAMAFAAVMFIMLWVATDDARAAALVTLVAILVLILVFLILWAHHSGARQANETATAIVASMAAMVTVRSTTPPAPLDDGSPPVGDVRFLRSGNQMHLKDKVETAGVQVWSALYPHTPPTRANIKTVTRSQSDEFCSLVLQYLRDKQLVEAGGQGVISAWKRTNTEE